MGCTQTKLYIVVDLFETHEIKNREFNEKFKFQTSAFKMTELLKELEKKSIHRDLKPYYYMIYENSNYKMISKSTQLYDGIKIAVVGVIRPYTSCYKFSKASAQG